MDNLRTITIQSDLTDDCFRKYIYPLLKGRMFHSTSVECFSSILKDQAVFCGSEIGIQEWRGIPYFRSRGYVSFCDFFNCTNYELIRIGRGEYNFECPKFDSERYLIVLKTEHHSLATSWFNVKNPRGERLVRFIESGIEGPLPLSFFEFAYRVIYPKELAKFNQIQRELA